MDYPELKKIDEESLKKMTEGPGPVDECLCSLLSPPENNDGKGIRASIKKAFTFGSSGKQSRKRNGSYKFRKSVDVPLNFKTGSGVASYKEEVSNPNCEKCPCGNKKFVLKHSIANIRVTAPDISTICSCPEKCLPEEAYKLNNNIKITIERVDVRKIDTSDSEFSIHEVITRQSVGEPDLSNDTPVLSFCSSNESMASTQQDTMDYIDDDVKKKAVA